MTLEVLRGADAHRAIEDPRFRANWKSLHRVCPWSTVFQDPSFASTWYRVYRDVYEPIIAVGFDGGGAMNGLFLLARNRKSGALVHVGVEHAEYQTWIARADRFGFISDALDALKPIAAGATLQLRYVPSTVPLEPLASSSDWGWRTVSWLEGRGIADLTTADGIASRVELNRYRYRMRRLAALGPVNFRTISGRSELEPWLDRIIAFCDVRQGAVNASFPFHDDSLYRELQLSMMEVPELLHATLLTAGSILVSAHLNFVDRRTISLGLISHSPMHGKISPGTLHLLLLARYAANSGFDAIDLTPAGDYKNRFASVSDPTRVVSIQFSATQAARAQVRHFAAEKAKTHIREIGLEPAQVKRQWVKRIARIRRSIAGWRLAPAGVRNAAFAGDILILRFPGVVENSAKSNSTRASSSGLRIDQVGDLLLPRPSGVPVHERRTELRAALARFERGATMITRVVDGMVTDAAWVVNGPGRAHIGHAFADVELSESSILIHAIDGSECFVEDVLRLVCVEDPKLELLAAVHATDVAMVQHLSKTGAEIVARISPRTGRTKDRRIGGARPGRLTTGVASQMVGASRGTHGTAWH